METKTDDIRVELEAMMAEIQHKIVSLKEEEDKIGEQLKDAESALAALRTVYEIQSRRLGEYKAHLFPRKGAPSRFAGMRLVDALLIIRQENPRIDKRQALKILEKEGFDFRGKRPLPAVHFAWVALERRKK
jgi:hypothetical protein